MSYQTKISGRWVTYWDVCRQRWDTCDAGSVDPSILATLPAVERDAIIEAARLPLDGEAPPVPRWALPSAP